MNHHSFTPHRCAFAVRSVALPAESRIAGWYSDANLADAFAIALHRSTRDQPVDMLARQVLANPPRWIVLLLAVRDAVVARLELKTSGQLRSAAMDAGADHIDFFRVLLRSDTEVIVGEDDGHLEFRVSFLLRQCPDGPGPELVATTVVRCHNRLGRIYLALISPFHRLIVKTSLARASRRGWKS